MKILINYDNVYLINHLNIFIMTSLLILIGMISIINLLINNFYNINNLNIFIMTTTLLLLGLGIIFGRFYNKKEFPYELFKFISFWLCFQILNIFIQYIFYINNDTVYTSSWKILKFPSADVGCRDYGPNGINGTNGLNEKFDLIINITENQFSNYT